VPVERWGPRVIDLDLLVHGQARSSDESLTLPHPGLTQRDFVLVPLAEICPLLTVPGVGRVDALLQALGPTSLERIDT
jgi:2-amino-4-hydroxy-6-hydroxymethyldihydropteridine diphosphokinase